MREEFFSKFKDYNNELEKILEKKDFSKDSKNLLLSMFYKLESSYEDYQTVKRGVKTKQEYLENILNNIKQCNRIIIVKPTDEEFVKWTNDNKKYEVDLKLKKIKVIENEVALLSAILDLNDFKIYLEEKYNLIRNSFPYLINVANDMNQTEVLRDFNAFSWNISVKDIPNIPISLIYENLKLSLTIDIIENLQYSQTNHDIIQLIVENMKTIYDEKKINQFLLLIFKISIIIYIQENEQERKRLKEEYENLEKELTFIKDKKEYISYITANKQKMSQNLKEVELILKSKELLEREYEKRNNMLSEYHKIFSLSHLVEKLQREKEKYFRKIEEYNHSLEPKNYLENKQKLQNDFNLLKKINFEDPEKNQKLLYATIKNLQLLFLKELLPKRIEKAKTKEGFVNLIYEIRYYLMMMYSEKLAVKDVEELNQASIDVISLLLKKMYDFKLMTTLSTNEKIDIQIVSHIFYLSMVSLEDIYMELIPINKKENKYQITIFDDKDTIEENIELELNFNKKDRVKLKKKVKLF